MPYIEFDVTLPDHPKTAYAARLAGIGIPQVLGHLTCLWKWAIDYAQDGDLSAYPPDVIETAMKWAGEPGVLLAALINCRFGNGHGFIEDDGGLRIHDWWEHAGKLIEKRRTDAERKRELRSDKPSQPPVAAPSDGRPMDVAAPSDGRPMDVAGCLDIPDQTRPNPTRPDQTTPKPTKPRGGRGGKRAAGGGEEITKPPPETVTAILTDPDVGMIPERAAQFAKLPVETVLSHVLAWQREGKTGTLGIGALHWRLKNRPNAPALRDEDRLTPLYVRHVFGGDRAAAEAEANRLRYSTPGVLH